MPWDLCEASNKSETPATLIQVLQYPRNLTQADRGHTRFMSVHQGTISSLGGTGRTAAIPFSINRVVADNVEAG